jgi:hypothetical protein
MSEYETFKGLALVLSQGRSILRKLHQANLADQHKEQVTAALDLVSDATDRLQSIQADAIDLRHENAALKEKLAAADDWKSRRAEYQLVQSPGGAFVLEDVHPPTHFACPSCAESKREIHILQPGSIYTGTSDCPSCKTQYNVQDPNLVQRPTYART